MWFNISQKYYDIIDNSSIFSQEKCFLFFHQKQAFLFIYFYLQSIPAANITVTYRRARTFHLWF